MKIKLMVDDKVVFEKDILDVLETNAKPDFVTLFNNYHGVREYEGIVAEIQKWFYGSLVRASWCATSLSYFANKLGVLDKIGGKNENVYKMMESCRKSGKGLFFDKQHIPEKIEKNDILFWLWQGDTMTVDSSKHVGVAEYDSTNDTIYCLGGNQNDKICTSAYNRNKLYAVYRIL